MDEREKLLIKKCRSGDVEAFEQLISSYERRAYNIALRVMGNEEDAKDMAQEAFIRIYRAIKDFKEQSAFSTWLYRIVTNVCLDEIRKRKKQKLVSLEGNLESTIGDVQVETGTSSGQPEAAYELEEQKRVIMKAIYELSEEYKTAVILRDIQGFSYEEIAAILDCSSGTVKSRISRGRNLLRDKLRIRLELSISKSV